MPDVTMCQNKDCPLSQKCYRHEDSGTKPSEYWQSYSVFKYVNGKCEHFVPVEKR